jgi:hypothetical protein
MYKHGAERQEVMAESSGRRGGGMQLRDVAGRSMTSGHVGDARAMPLWLPSRGAPGCSVSFPPLLYRWRVIYRVRFRCKLLRWGNTFNYRC